MFTNLILKSLDEPGMFEVAEDVQWTGSIHFKEGDVNETGIITITVPRGFKTDFASVPIGLRSIINRLGPSRKPSVFHDFNYERRYRTRKQCDQLFRQMLLERGASRFTAWCYYIGVRSGGWTRGSW